MMRIDWQPTVDGAAMVPLSLPDVRDVAMAIDLAWVIEHAATGRSGAARGFAIKDAEGVTLFRSGDEADGHSGVIAGERGEDPVSVCAIGRTKDGNSGALLKLGPGDGDDTHRAGRIAIQRQSGRGAEIKLALGRAAERELLQKPVGGEAAPLEASIDASPGTLSASPDAAPCVPPPASGPASKHRPSVADLRELTAPSIEPPSKDGSAANLASVRQSLGRLAARGRIVSDASRRLLADVARRTGAAETPLRIEREAVEASAVARKLGVDRLVAAAEAPPEKRRVLADHVDYWVLGTAAALLIVVGSPIYSVYATMSQVKAAEGRVIGNDIDLAHLRGSLREDAAPARLAEGRSVARDTGPVRFVGTRTLPEPDIVTETLGALARGPAFATVSSGESIDFRKLFWHLRPVSPSRIDVRLFDAHDVGRRRTLVFRRSTFWSWKLFDIRFDRDA